MKMTIETNTSATKQVETKAGLKAYQDAAVASARHGMPQHEGSLTPTGSVYYVHRTNAEALEHYVTLHAQGYRLEHSHPVMVDNMHSFTLNKNDELFAKDEPTIRARAAQDYAKSIAAHNLELDRAIATEAAIVAEVNRRETDRLAALTAQVRMDLQRAADPRFARSETHNG